MPLSCNNIVMKNKFIKFNGARNLSTFFLRALLIIPCSFDKVAICAESTSGTYGASSSNQQSLANRSKGGSALKIIKNNFSMGTLLGGGYSYYETNNLSIGGYAYTGQLTQGAIGHFSYGGLSTNYRWPLGSQQSLEMGLLIGGGGGATATLTGGGFALEPSLGFSSFLGKITRLSLEGGYFWLPSATPFSGVTGTIRIEFVN